MSVIEIWQPRYKDNKVLIATYKIKSGYNFVKFTKAKHLEGKLFRVHSIDVLDCPIQKNGNIAVFIVPMECLELVNEEEKPIQKHVIKMDIDGSISEFTDIDEVINVLAKMKEGK